MTNQLDYPVSDVHKILRACNAAEPLQPQDKRWYDFADLRHAQVLSRLEKAFLQEPAPGKYHHRLLCGHRGCGKSTELLRFKQSMADKGFHAERIEVDVHFGHIQLEFSDFFLLAATAAERALKELNKPLPKKAVKPIIDMVC